MTSQNSDLGLELRHREIVVEIIRALAPQAEVWAFGSRVRGNYHSGSDLDLVIRHGLPVEGLTELKNAFSESDLPFLVDILHWDLIPEVFRKAIEERYVVVK